MYIGKCGSFILILKTSYIKKELCLQGVSVSLRYNAGALKLNHVLIIQSKNELLVHRDSTSLNILGPL